MTPGRPRRQVLPTVAVLLFSMLLPALAQAQGQRYWVGGSGQWSDPAHWTATPNGPGGAGIPGSGDAVIIAANGSETVVHLSGNTSAGDLRVDGSNGTVMLAGSEGTLHVDGSLGLKGSVVWTYSGMVELHGDAGVNELDLRGIPLASDLRFAGGGTWSMRSDLVLADDATLDLQTGTLATNGNMLRAGVLHIADQGAKLMAGNSVVLLARALEQGEDRSAVDAGNSMLLVAGEQTAWGGVHGEVGSQRGSNVCATGPGQTPFTIDAQLTSNYHGFGVSCHGVCDGSVQVTVVGGVGPFTYNWIGGPATANWNNVCPGNQIVIVTDQGQDVSCATTVQVTDPPLLSVIFTGVVPPACAGSCNGSVSAFAVGGVSPYDFSWNNGTGTGSSFNQLCAGNNTLHVTDANGCAFDTTFSFPVQPIVPNLSTTDVQCSGGCDGTAQVVPAGGSGPYTYNWGPGNPIGDGGPSVTGLCAGSNYTVTIIDANGCDTIVPFAITEPVPITPNASQVNATCGNMCDGSATVNPTGATGPFTYNWSPPPGGANGNPTATDLCVGVYEVTITDQATSCDTVVSFTIVAADTMQVFLTPTAASCANVCDGSAQAVVDGGVPLYTYTWTPGPGTGQGSAGVSGLCPGPGTVLVEDANGCQTTADFTITAPDSITVDAVVTDASCSGACDGSITLAPSGGNGTYNYAWTPVSAGTGATATNLCPGDYQVQITSGGCTTVLSFTISAPTPINATLTVTDMGCAGVCDGMASVSVSGPGPFTYNWEPGSPAGDGSPTATGLCAGNWSVTVSDGTCDTTLAFTITGPDPLTITPSQTNTTCTDTCGGTATGVVGGGALPYTYSWSPPPGSGQGSATAGDLCPGAWTLTVTDANDCETSHTFTIEAVDTMQVFVTPSAASCADACDGSAQAVVDGGMPLYTYTWTPVPDNGQGDPGVSGLCPGPGTVLVEDANGCQTTAAFIITAPDSITADATITDAGCNGACTGSIVLVPAGGNGTYNYAWTPVSAGTGATATNLCPGDYEVLITSGGCDTVLNFTIGQPVPIDVALATTPTTCTDSCGGTATLGGNLAGLSFNWQPEPGSGQGTATATGLCAGPYEVIISNGSCDTTIQFTIDGPQPILPNLTVTPETCSDSCTGTATVSPSGGTGPYTFLWAPEPGTGQGSSSVTGLCAGVNYSVVITDSLGCEAVAPFTVQPSTPMELTVFAMPISCADTCDGAAMVVVDAGGIPPYTYVWSVNAPGQGTDSISGLCHGFYNVEVTDSAGCDTVQVFAISAPLPIIPVATVTNTTCAGLCNGEIVLAPTGGSGSFTYSWNPLPPNMAVPWHATQLCAGDWSVTITDGNGCDTTVTYTVEAPAPITVAADVTDSHCNACDGAIQLHVSGGAGTYLFTWGPPLNFSTNDSLLVGLCAGLYAVTVTDTAGCPTTLVVAVADADGEALAATDGLTSCPGTCDGSVSVSYTCDVAPCTLVWTSLAGDTLAQGVDTLSGLCAGGYLASVTNGNGCISMDTAIVDSPAPMTADITSTPPSCSSGCDGTATIGITGGIGPFTYTWDPLPGGGQGTEQATDLCPGTYEIHVQDQGSGCEATFSVLITAPDSLAVNAVVNDVSCAGQCDGSIVLNVQGGTAPYTFTWPPMLPIGPLDSSATNLCPGVYEVTVSDAGGCSTTLNLTVAEPQPITLSATTTSSHCGICDGSVTLGVGGGNGPYDIQWTDANGPVGTGETLTGLCAGLYTANVTDANGCTAALAVVVPDVAGETIEAMDGQVFCASTCDGVVSVAYACGDAPCTVSWFDAGGNLLAQGQDTLGGLCPGTYLVHVLNGSGCTSMDTALVVPTQVIIPNLSTTPVSCADLCNGMATVAPTGGMAPYTYSWSPPPGGGQGQPQATALCAGTYEVTITDSLGCDTVVEVLITAPDSLTVDAQVEQVSCDGANDGSIVLSPSGGNGFYSYAWTPVPPNGQGSNGAFDLSPGVWTVWVADIEGCGDSLSFTITAPDPLVASAASTLSHCNVCDGTASVVITGGTAPYVITWTLGGSPVGTDSTTITDLCAGLYMAEVEDAHGCTVETLVPVGDAGGEDVSVDDALLNCPGDCNGVLEAVFDCTVPTCTTAWFDAAGTDLNEPGNTLANLCAGSYFVQVTNGAGCITVDTAMVLAPDPIIANLGTTAVTCPDACDGTATVGPTGGAGGYQYAWVIGTDTITGVQQVDSLCAGTYQVTITDAAGCSITQGVLITAPDPITATAVVVPITCNGACDGSITVMGQGGADTLQYSWIPEPPNGQQGSSTITGLCAGDWTVTISDGSCDTSFTLTLTDPPVLVVSLTHTDNECFTDCGATAHVDISGGLAPYTISWTGPDGTVIAQDTTDVAGLCGGVHEVIVTDALGCTFPTTFTVGSGAPIEANLTWQSESCNGPCDGFASVSPAGGTGAGYTIAWGPTDPVGQGTEQVTGLCSGEWTVTITDSIGCDTTYTFNILPFAPITPVATVQQVTCNGACDGSISLNVTGGTDSLTYVWTPEPGAGQGTPGISSLCPDTFTVVISDVAGCDTTVQFIITEPTAVEVQVDTVIQASCNTAADGAIDISISGGVPDYTLNWAGPDGFTSSDEDLANLVPGTYQITVTDANNCTVTSTIDVATLNTLVADAGPDQTLCAGSGIVLDGTASQGASSFQWTDGQGGVIGTDAMVDLGVLPDSTYIFVLTVEDGLCTDVDTLTITVLPTPFANAGPDQVVYVEGTVQLGGTPSGPDGSAFSWQPDSLLDHADIPNPNATVDTTIWFVLTVSSPDGCVSVDSVLVTMIPEVSAPSGFTPNGDGYNDVWVLGFVQLFPDMEVQVFSRWGEPLFHSKGYEVPWDGKYDGKVVPMGTYYYVIELNDPRFPEALTGPLTVIR